MKKNPVGPPKRTGDPLVSVTMENKGGSKVDDWTVTASTVATAGTTSHSAGQPVDAGTTSSAWSPTNLSGVNKLKASVRINLTVHWSPEYTAAAKSKTSFKDAAFKFENGLVTLDDPSTTYN